MSSSLLIKQSLNGTYKVHLGTFSTSREAAQYMDEIDFERGSLEVVPRKITPRETWYRVMAGPFADRDNALKAVEDMKKAERPFAIFSRDHRRILLIPDQAHRGMTEKQLCNTCGSRCRDRYRFDCVGTTKSYETYADYGTLNIRNYECVEEAFLLSDPISFSNCFSFLIRCNENHDLFYGQLRIFFLYRNVAQLFPYDSHLTIIMTLRSQRQRIFDPSVQFSCTKN